METMTASQHRQRPATSSSPAASETTRFPSAAAYAAALEAQASAPERRAGTSAPLAGSAVEAAVTLRELRLLLEENLTALRAVYEDQRRTIAGALTAVDAARDEIRALGQAEAPWIAALDQTRGLIRAAFAEIAAQHAANANSRR
jgi:hypothetical protein